ncbi:arginase family protein [Micromonospora echinaurantiaca]
MMRRIAVLDAPSNLGLRPPTATSVPGCAKAPGALRDHDLLARLRARDAGCLTPPRYDPGDWRPGDGVCHAREISDYSVALADRIGSIIDRGEFPLVLGGDCSVLLGSALAMHRLGEAVGGRIGLVFVDGHSDFRHPGNASYVGAAAGEDLALVTGRGQADLAAIEGRRPYFRDIDVVVLGIRAQDEYRLDLQAAGIVTRPVPALRAEGAARTAQWAHEQLADCAGYWVHIDVDVLDPAVMPAVDAPDPGGIAFAELEILLAGLVDTPHCLGVELTVFDPDYDPDGAYAAEIVNTVVAGLAPVSAPEAVPPRLLPGPSSTRAARPGNGRSATRVVPPRGAVDADRPTGPDPDATAPPASLEPVGLSGAAAAAGRGEQVRASGAAVAAGRGEPVRASGAAVAAGLEPVVPPGSAVPAGLEPVGPSAAELEPVGPPAAAGPGLLRRNPLAMTEPPADPDADDDLSAPEDGTAHPNAGIA